MKFGIFILPSWPEAETSHQGRIYQEAVEQIQYAEELGFDAVWLAEHHFTRFGIISSAIPFATYVAAHTKTIRIGTGVSVLTFHNKYATFSGSQEPTGYQPRMRLPRMRKRGSRGGVTRGSGVVVVYPTSAGSYPTLRISSARLVWRASMGTEFCTTRWFIM